jgi:hypothetical protein
MAALSASPSAQESGDSAAQVAYTSTTRQGTKAGQYIVEITNTSNALIQCDIQYSGQTSMGADRSGERALFVPGAGSDGKPAVRSTPFAGFRSFTATVNCAAR